MMASNVSTGYCDKEPYNISSEDQPLPSAIITKGVFLTIAVTISLVFNMICLVVLHRVRDRSLNHVTKIFMISFTMCDFFGIVFVYIPMTVSTFLNDWPFGHGICVINGFASTIFAYTSGIQLLGLNLERYLAITYPLKWYSNYVTPKRAKLAVVVIWASAFAFSVFAYLLPGRYTTHSPFLALCTSNPCGHGPDISGTILSSIFSFLPVLLTMFLWLKMYLVARRHTGDMIAQAKSVNHGTIATLERGTLPANEDSNTESPSRKDSAPCTPKSPVRKDMDRKASRVSLSGLITLDRRKASKNISPAELAAINANNRAFFTFFIMSICMAVITSPFIIVVVYDNVKREMLSYTYIAIAEFLIVSFGFLNVIIYYARNAAFRRTAIKLFSVTADPYSAKPCKSHITNGRSVAHGNRDDTMAEL